MNQVIQNVPAQPAGHDLIELLHSQGQLNDEQAEQVRRRMRRAQITPQQAILDLAFVTQEVVYRALSQITGIPFIIVGEQEIAEAATTKVTAKVALRYQFVPMQLERGTLKAAFANPPSIRDRENLRLLLGLRLDPVLATPHEVNNVLKRIYGLGAEKVIQLRQDRKALQLDDNEGAFNDKIIETIDEDTENQDASIINLVNEIIGEAVKLHTTDIHIEPFRDKVKVRYRIDGMLREIPTPPGMVELHEAIISRIKIMAKLNIAEKRLPHDGRIRLIMGGKRPTCVSRSCPPVLARPSVCVF